MLSSGLHASGPITAAVASPHSTVIGCRDRFSGRVSTYLTAPCGRYLHSRRVPTFTTRVCFVLAALRQLSAGALQGRFRPSLGLLDSLSVSIAGPPAGDVPWPLPPGRCRWAGDFQRCHHTVADGRGDLGQQLRLNHPQLRRPGRRFGCHAEHSVTQSHRGRMVGDLRANHRPPLTEHRAFGDMRGPAALLRQITRHPAQRFGSRTSGPGPDQLRRRPAMRRVAGGTARPRPASFPCARAAARASSRVRLTKSMPVNSRGCSVRSGSRRSSGPVTVAPPIPDRSRRRADRWSPA